MSQVWNIDDIVPATTSPATDIQRLIDGLNALRSVFSGASEPAAADQVAYMLWADTTAGQLKIRNAANSAWVTIGALGSPNLGLLSGTGGNLTGGLNDAMTVVASATTPNIFATTVGNTIDYTGTTTCTGFAAAPQAGAKRKLVCASTPSFTAGTNLLIPGVASGQTYTAVAGEVLEVVALTTTQFRLLPQGTTVIGQSNKTVAYTTVMADRGWLINCTTGTFTVTLLPAATAGSGFTQVVLNSGSGVITIDPNGAELIDGLESVSLSPGRAATILCTGTAWITISDVGNSIATQAEVSAMTDTTRAVTANHNKIILGTKQNSTLGTSIDFTGIPSGVRRITIGYSGVSTNGASVGLVQIGSSGGIETTGYLGSAGVIVNASTSGAQIFSTGMGVYHSLATDVIHGVAVLTLMDATTNQWSMMNTIGNSAASYVGYGGSVKTLLGVLDRVRITTVGGTDTFDSGAINIIYER